MFETDVFRLVNDLPGVFEGPLRVVMQAGSLPAVPAAALVALATRRPRLARDLTLAGGGAWIAAKAFKEIVGRGRPGSVLPHDMVFRGGLETGLGFPSGHAAVAAAIAAAASTYLGRTGRRVAWSGVAVVGIARIFVGAHLPVDVIGGVVLGWVIAALGHLLFGAPDGGADEATVTAVLAGVVAVPFELARASVDARASTPFYVETAHGDHWFVKGVSHIQRDADLAFKGWRLITRRGLEDEAPFATPKQMIEHEAYLTLLALRAGVLTPSFVTAASSRGTAVVVFERLDARPLDTFEPSEVTDKVLGEVWANVVRLREARIAHRDLRLANVLLGPDYRPWLVDFGFAEAAAGDHRLAQDVAELLASSALVVGVDRAVAAAQPAVGIDGLAGAVTLLQPLALSSATRHSLHEHGKLLGELRTSAARAATLDDPALEQLARIRPRTICSSPAPCSASTYRSPRSAKSGAPSTRSARSSRRGSSSPCCAASLPTWLPVSPSSGPSPGPSPTSAPRPCR